jgi:ubiquinone/menaquinone biosynthesis C-methylase UbiE
MGRLGNNRPKVLKADLWNEGIETSRDVLGQFEKYETVGFDVSKTVCQHAKRRLRKPGLLQATCQALPFSSNSFDLVLDLSTIDHMPFATSQKVLTEYYRVLKPQGLLAIAFWQSNIATKYLMSANPDQLYFDRKQIAKSLEQIGFEIVDSYNLGSLLTIMESNFWLGQVMFWQLKAVFKDSLIKFTTKVEPYTINYLGGLHVFYSVHP